MNPSKERSVRAGDSAVEGYSVIPGPGEPIALFQETGLVIMASGLGKRFGFNKLLADFDGQPLIRRILSVSDGLFKWRVVVTRHKEVEDLCRLEGIPVLLHEQPGRNDTIRLGLEWMLDAGKKPDGLVWNPDDGPTAQSRLRTCIFAPADQPLLSRESLIRLGQAAEKDRDAFIRLGFKGRVGTPTAFPAWSFQELMALPEGKGGNLLLRKYPETVKEAEAAGPYELMDVDTPEMLAELLAWYRELQEKR